MNLQNLHKNLGTSIVFHKFSSFSVTAVILFNAAAPRRQSRVRMKTSVCETDWWFKKCSSDRNPEVAASPTIFKKRKRILYSNCWSFRLHLLTSVSKNNEAASEHWCQISRTLQTVKTPGDQTHSRSTDFKCDRCFPNVLRIYVIYI